MIGMSEPSIDSNSTACSKQAVSRWGVARPEARSGERAAPERDWCGARWAAKTPGLTERRYGECTRSGIQPTGKLPPDSANPTAPRPKVVDNRVSERSCSGGFLHYAYRGWVRPSPSPKDSSGQAGEQLVTVAYPEDVRDIAKSGMGCQANRHLRCLAESDHENVGGCQRDAKGSRPPRPEEASSQQ